MKTVEVLLLRIKTLRIRYGLTQAQMAEKINVSLKAWQKIEKGSTKMDLDRLSQIAEIFHTLPEILIRTDQKTQGVTPILNVTNQDTVMMEKEYYERIIDIQQQQLERYQNVYMFLMNNILQYIRKS